MQKLLVALALVAVGLAGCADGGVDALRFEAPSCGILEIVEHHRTEAVLVTSMGDIRIALEDQKAPQTVANFVNLAKDDFYDGQIFHRVISDFMMQGGDPRGTGSGGPGYQIDDEFHQDLRHDRKGTLSMANAGPNTGGSQFFVTFGPTPWLDDKHSVFGYVIDGMDVLDAVNRDVASSSGTPQQQLRLEDVILEEFPVATELEAPKIWLPVPTLPVAENKAVGTVVVVDNPSNVVQEVCVSAFGAELGIDPETQSFQIPAGASRAVVLEVLGVPADGFVEIQAKGALGTAKAVLTTVVSELGAVGAEGKDMEGNYVGFLRDGRVFDTSLPSVRDVVVAEGRGTGSFTDRGDRYSTFSFTPGGGVIQGFTDLAYLTHEGSSNAAVIPAANAYGASGQHALAGKDLIFYLEHVA